MSQKRGGYNKSRQEYIYRLQEQKTNQFMDDLERLNAEIRVLRAQLAEATAGKMPDLIDLDFERIRIDSLLAAADKKPRVIMRYGTLITSFSPEEAIEHSVAIIRVAETAMTDAFVWWFFADQLKINPDVIGQIFMDFRRFREEGLGERKEPTPENEQKDSPENG